MIDQRMQGCEAVTYGNSGVLDVDIVDFNNSPAIFQRTPFHWLADKHPRVVFAKIHAASQLETEAAIFLPVNLEHLFGLCSKESIGE